MSATGSGRASGRSPFDEARLRDLFQRLSDYPSVALAVSGGADSMALMLLVKRWLEFSSLTRPEVTVLSVDHGLRKEAASEAEWVEERAEELDFSHKTLVWTAAKPAHGLQAAARQARYGLIARFCRHHAIPAMVTAHTSDDQAETVMMRLARGSGLDGLSAMSFITNWKGIDILRPLLATSRAELEAFLKDQQQAWLEDPTNRDESFERVRVRRALQAVRKLGIVNEKLGLSARRLGRAREALETITADFLKSNLSIHEAGFGEIDAAIFFRTPEEVALRSLARMIQAFGGGDDLPQLSKIEDAYLRLKTRPKSLTLGGCRIILRRERLLIFREYGRMELAETPLFHGDERLWDGRFSVRLNKAASRDFTLRALAADGIVAVKDAGGDFRSIPRTGALTLPSIWQDGELVYVPFTHFVAAPPQSWIYEASAEFANTPILYANRTGTIE